MTSSDPPPPGGAPPSPFTPHYLVVPGRALRDPRLSDKAKLLLGLCNWRSDEQGVTHLRVARAAATLGLDDIGSARRLFAQLERAGYLRRESRYSEGRGQTTNRYVLLYPTRPWENPGADVPPPSKNARGTPVQTHPAPPGENARDRIDVGEDDSPSSGEVIFNIVTAANGAEVVHSFPDTFTAALVEAITPYLHGVRFPKSIIGSVRAHLEGMHPPTCTAEEAARAITEMQASGVSPFNALAFASYLARTVSGAGTRIVPRGKGGRTSAADGLLGLSRRRPAGGAGGQ